MDDTPQRLIQDIEQMIPLKSKNDDTQKLSTYQQLKNLKGNVTVEPILAFFIMSSVISTLAIQNLNLDKACRVNLKFNDSVCTALTLRKRDNLSFAEDEVQKLIASVEAWKTVIQTAFPVILMMFIGAWSDKTGKRKICMLMPIGGELISCIFSMINTYFFYEVPVELTAFFAIIFQSMTGAWYIMFLGSYSYLGDITSKQARTFRLGILSLGLTIGMQVGTALSGILLRYTGYYGVFGLSTLIQLTNFLYIIFFIDDPKWLETQNETTPKGIFGFLVDFFNFKSFKETLQIIYKNGPIHHRLKIWLILIMDCLTFGSFWGETSIMYIFCRYRFNWDEFRYSIFSFYSLILHTIGTMIAVGIFSKKLKCDDSFLGIISTMSRICGALIWAFARNNQEIYFAPLVDILNGTIAVALRSIASKLVPSQELGKVYSLVGLAETIVPLIFAPLYTRLYIATLHQLPGAPFLISVLSSIPSLFVFIWLFRQHRNNATKTALFNDNNKVSTTA